MSVINNTTELNEEIKRLKDRIAELEKAEKSLKKTEKELSKNERKFRDLVELLPQTVYEMDLEGNFRFTNDYGIKCFGYSQTDIEKGINFLDLFIPDDRERVRENIRKICQGEPSRGNEYRCLRKDGTTFDSLFYSNPIIQDGKPVGLRGVVIDITDRKKAEKELQNSRDQLRNLASHLQSIREEERLLIAREIHDELGQALTALKMDLIWMYKYLRKDQQDVIEKVKSMSQLIDVTMRTVRRISTELRPGLLDDLGLTAALEWYCDEFQNRTGIRCDLDLHNGEIVLDQERSIAIFRVFQETLTNVARHAKATKIKAKLLLFNHQLEMEIHDNGIGISEEQINSPKSLGIIGLKERVGPWDGSVEIRGIDGVGTTVKVTLPLQSHQRKDD